MERNEIHGQRPDGDINIAPWLGVWHNSNEKTEWIREFGLAMEGDRCMIHIKSEKAPHVWGPVPASLYMDNIGEIAFFAEIDLPDLDARLAANMNKGLWVIAAFLRFKDPDQTNFLCREFFFMDP